MSKIVQKMYKKVFKKHKIFSPQVSGYFRNFNLDGMFFPVISSSAKVSCRFLFGGDHGRLKYSPPAGFSPLFESLRPMQQLHVDPGENRFF